jgi:glycine oxidase
MKAGIIGAGIMGRLLAFELSHHGWQVCLYDKGDPEEHGSCSMAAAGLLTPYAELEKSDSVIFNLGIEAVQVHWPRIINRLNDNIYFSQSGSIMLSHVHDRDNMYQTINVIQSKLGSEKNYRQLTQNDICNLEPELTKFSEGFYFPAEGQLDNQTVMHSLRNYLAKKNIQFITNTLIEEIDTKQYDMIFDCRGLGAKAVFKNLRGVRGELIWLHAPEVNISRPIRLAHPRYNLYIAPRPDHIYILGASEIESEDMSNISVRTLFELLSSAYFLHTGFAEARLLKTVVNCRPTLSDHLPKIKYSDNYISVNGLYRHGFLIAPALVCEILRWLQQGVSSLQYPILWERVGNDARNNALGLLHY